MPAPQLAGRSALQVQVVVVVVAGPPLRVVLARRFLLVDVGHHLLPERAVVEPVVAHPAVDHRVHRHGHFERGMRVDERHQRQEPVVRDAEDADVAVGFRHVPHEPFDRVVRVGRVIDRRRILRSVQRPVHHVVAFRSVLAADVLDDADVAALDDHVGRVVIPVEDGTEMRALRVARQLRGVVRSAREKNGSGLFSQRSFRHEDDGVELHPVAHRNPHVAALVVERVGHRREQPRRLARQLRILRRLRKQRHDDDGRHQQSLG